MREISQSFSDTINEVMNQHYYNCLPNEVIEDLYEGFYAYLEYASYGSGNTPFDKPAKDPKDDRINELEDKIDSLISVARSQGLSIGFEANSKKACYFKRVPVGASHSTVHAYYE